MDPIARVCTELALKAPTSYFRTFEVLKNPTNKHNTAISVLSSQCFILIPSPRDGWIRILQFSVWRSCSPAQRSVFIPRPWRRLINPFFSLKVDHWAVRKGARWGIYYSECYPKCPSLCLFLYFETIVLCQINQWARKQSRGTSQPQAESLHWNNM